MVCVGIQHLKGTSKKTGEAYDFYQISALARTPRMESGLECQKISVSPAVWKQFPLEIGDQFRATTDGFIVPLSDELRLEDLCRDLQSVL